MVTGTFSSSSWRAMVSPVSSGRPSVTTTLKSMPCGGHRWEACQGLIWDGSLHCNLVHLRHDTTPHSSQAQSRVKHLRASVTAHAYILHGTQTQALAACLGRCCAIYNPVSDTHDHLCTRTVHWLGMLA